MQPMTHSSPALRTVWLDAQAQLAGAVTRLAQGDAEAIHDARVATRRLETLLFLLRPKGHRKVTRAAQRAVGDLRRALGQSRDLEVTAELLAEHRATLPPAQREAANRLLSRMRRTVRAQRDAAVHTAGPALQRAQDAMRAFEAAVSADAGTRVWKRLDALASRVLDAAQVVSRRQDVTSMHRMRVHFKRLRYALEALHQARLLDLQDAGKRALKGAQEAMGQTMDVFVAAPVVRDALPAFARALEETCVRDTQAVVSVVSHWTRSRAPSQ